MIKEYYNNFLCETFVKFMLVSFGQNFVKLFCNFFCKIYLKSQYFYFVKKRFFNVFVNISMSYYWFNKQVLLKI